jgi:hypothetical protein
VTPEVTRGFKQLLKKHPLELLGKCAMSNSCVCSRNIPMKGVAYILKDALEDELKMQEAAIILE